MNKTRKKLFGALGLALVAGMTTVAACLPSPNVSAVSSVTDTIQIRVVGNNIEATITKPASGSKTAAKQQEIAYTYQNAEKVTFSYTYTALDGTVATHDDYYVLDDLDYNAGGSSFYLNQDTNYGTYTLTVVATGAATGTNEQIVTWEYVPVYATFERDEDTGIYYAVLDYDASLVDSFDIDLYQVVDGGTDTKLTNTPIHVTAAVATAAGNKVKIPLTEEGSTGLHYYYLNVTTYDADDNVLYEPFDTNTLSYEGVLVPDTGSFFQNLNIAKEDYLITGLIIFFVFGVVALGIVARGHKTTKSSKRR